MSPSAVPEAKILVAAANQAVLASLLGAGKTASDVLFVLIPIALVSGTVALFMIRMASKQKIL